MVWPRLFPAVFLAYAASVSAMLLLWSLADGGRAGPGGVGDPSATRAGAPWLRNDAHRAHATASRQVRLLLLNAILVYAGIHLALSFAPLYLREASNGTRRRTGWSGSAASAGAAALLYAVERRRGRWGATTAMWVSCALIALHLGATTASPLLWVQFAGFFCLGWVQTASRPPPLRSAKAMRPPAPHSARRSPSSRTVAGVSAVLAPPLGGTFYALSPAAPFFAGMVPPCARGSAHSSRVHAAHAGRCSARHRLAAGRARRLKDGRRCQARWTRDSSRGSSPRGEDRCRLARVVRPARRSAAGRAPGRRTGPRTARGSGRLRPAAPRGCPAPRPARGRGRRSGRRGGWSRGGGR